MSTLYKIKLQNFEGPLDLLLFFVRKDELNIYDIPLARITKSYLEYLQLMQDLNLDIASEFILMAATLMRIKVKMMLPKDPVAEDEEEMMDPREELSRRLIEYRQFKEASKSLSELDEYWRQVYRRSYFNFDLLPQNEEEVIGLKDISFFDLLAAYKRALEKKPIPVFHNVERLNVTVEEQQKYIMDFFRDRNCYLFTELCEDMAKIEIVVTFLALLDLVKRAEIAIKQASIFDDIWIYRASEFKDEAIPENERADAEIHELMEPVETVPTVSEVDSRSIDSENIAEKATEGYESHVEEYAEEIPNSPAEIKVEFIENEIKTVEVCDDNDPLEEKDVSQEKRPEVMESEPFVSVVENEVMDSPTEILGEKSSELELMSSTQENKIEPIDTEKRHLSELQHEVIYEQMTEEKGKIEIDEENVAGAQITIEKYDSEHMSIHSAASTGTNFEEKIQTNAPVIQEIVTENKLEPKETQVRHDSGMEEVEKDKQTLRSQVESFEPKAEPLIHEKSVPDAKRNDIAKDEKFIRSAHQKRELENPEKVSRWKNFLQKIVSIVRKMFSK